MFHPDTPSRKSRWPRYQHVIFDCDSTLSAVEGIDELAQYEDTRAHIADLTNAAMDGSVALNDVYAKRLEILNPTRGAVRALKTLYQQQVVEDTKALIKVLRQLNHEVYIVSGGLLDPVKEFGIWLGVEADNIRAVEIEYDSLTGNWWNQEGSEWQQQYLAYRQSELAESDGKAAIIRTLLSEKAGRSLLIGDGMSDCLAGKTVDLFIGYGGVVKRLAVAQRAPIFIQSHSLAPVLPLAVGSEVFENATDQEFAILRQKANLVMHQRELMFNHDDLREKFFTSFNHQ